MEDKERMKEKDERTKRWRRMKNGAWSVQNEG